MFGSFEVEEAMPVRKRAVQVQAGSTALVPVGPAGALSSEVLELLEEAEQDAADSLAGSTKRAYRHSWGEFASWCAAHGLQPLPASVAALVAYVEHMGKEGYRPATIRRALATVRQAHRRAGLEAPTKAQPVLDTMKGLFKKLGVVQRKAKPFFPEDLQKAYARLGTDLRGLRDRAMANLCFTGAFRRSEVVGLNVADVVFTPDGKMTVLLRSSKTDQLGEGRIVGIEPGDHEETCPVRTLRAWLVAAAITAGPLFREIDFHGKLTERRASDQAVYRLAKKLAALAELPDAERYTGHSFRAGFVTTADREGKSLMKIMDQTGHRDPKTLRGYMRDTDLFRNNASKGIGM